MILLRVSHLLRLVLMAAVIASCASGGTTPEAATVASARLLAYRATTPATLSYDFADTTRSVIQAGPIGAINVNITGKGVADLRFEPAGSNQKVTLTLREFAASFSNSASGTATTATAADVKGPIIFQLTPSGAVTVTQRPELSANFRTAAGSESNFRRFFLRLPAGAARVGSTWTDTLTTSETNEGITSHLRNVITLTYARDTVVNGQTALVITGSGQRSLEVSGVSQGVEIVQKLTGQVSSVALWDAQRNLLISKEERATLSGSFDLPAMNLANMPITATGRTLIQLRPGQ